tara:strand:- start:156 stop:368 length:213 start_codon:yes stop_codon:yes gene_type:complete
MVNRQAFGTEGIANSMAELDGWYFLLFLVAFCGPASWYTRNFTKNKELLKLFVSIGVISMIGLLIWTLQM